MEPRLPLGAWVSDFVGFLTQTFESEFRLFSDYINQALYHLVEFFMSTPVWIVIGVSAVLSIWLSKNWKNGAFVVLGLFVIQNLGFWRETLETVTLVLVATLVSAGIGVPLGIFCAHHPRAFRVMRPVLDFMQTIPTFVYLIPTLMLFGLGMAPGIISTVIFAMPAPIRLTALGVGRVPVSLLEVGEAFGASYWEKLFQIELPYALPTIRTGISQCVMLSLSMVVIAALVGAEGLGKPVVSALNTVDMAKGFEAGIAIVIIAVILDRVLMSGGARGSALMNADSV